MFPQFPPVSHLVVPVSPVVPNLAAVVSKDHGVHLSQFDLSKRPKLKLLFGLTQIKALEPRDLEMLLTHLEKEDVNTARNFKDWLVENHLLNEAETNLELAKLEYPHDLDTLLAEAVDEKPKKSDGILSNWNEKAAFFFHKSLYLADPLSGAVYHGLITHCDHDASEGLILQMQDGSEVAISSGEYKVTRRTKQEGQPEMIFKGIGEQNAEQCVLVVDEPDNHMLREFHWDKIKKKIDEVVSSLAEDNATPFLDELLEQLVANNMRTIPFDFIRQRRSNPLAKKLEEISHLLLNELKIKRSAEALLKQAVLDANSSLLFGIEETEIVARTMRLLGESFEHVDKIKGHDSIMFWGNTGAGKSATICSLLGAKFEVYFNAVGERVVKIKEEGVPANFPHIGQALATSETIYAQGYKLPGSEDLLIDCPGFKDTRGGDYELCTSISIDQAVFEAKQIKAVVIVLPIHAFQEKGNPVIQLLTGIGERFKGLFDPDHMEPSSRVFILITKQGQVPGDIANKIKDGTRIHELYREAQAQLNDLMQKDPESSLSINALNSRLRIWKSLHLMHMAKRIHFLDVNNQAARRAMLKSYSQTALHLDKSQYQPMLQSRDMQLKFGEQVVQSMKNWTERIFKQYLVDLPKQLGAAQKEVSKKKGSVPVLNGDKAIEHSSSPTLERQRVIDLKKQSRRLAIHIVSHLDRARLLRQFAAIVLQAQSKEESSESDSPFLKSCSEFATEYDKKLEKLFAHIKIDENLSI